MAEMNVKQITMLPISGSTKVTNINFFSVLLSQMKYLANTLYHFGYLIKVVMTTFEVNITIKDSTDTYRYVSKAMIFMHVFFDLLSYLEREVQCLRNGKEMGNYFIKPASDKNKQFNDVFFKFDDRLDANTYYLNKAQLKNVTKKNSNLITEFQKLYDEIESFFNDSKDQYNNYLKLIKKFELHYHIKSKSDVYILASQKNEKDLYHCNEIYELFKYPLLYLKQFVEYFGTNKSTYDRLSYEFKDRKRDRKLDEGLQALSNSMKGMTTTCITYSTLNLSSKPFIDYLTQFVKTFNIKNLEDVSFSFSFSYSFSFSFSSNILTLTLRFIY